jgi:hypothetical protein
MSGNRNNISGNRIIGSGNRNRISGNHITGSDNRNRISDNRITGSGNHKGCPYHVFLTSERLPRTSEDGTLFCYLRTGHPRSQLPAFLKKILLLHFKAYKNFIETLLKFASLEK